jgi:hypothetical protein
VSKKKWFASYTGVGQFHLSDSDDGIDGVAMREFDTKREAVKYIKENIKSDMSDCRVALKQLSIEVKTVGKK